MVNYLLIAVLFPYGVIFISLLIMVYQMATWKIPVTVFRFTGDKRRPLLIHTKGRKYQRHGVTELKIKGYKDPVRDFKNENYYPSPKKKFGALALFEFEDAQLTPVLPSLEELKNNPDYKTAVEVIKNLTATVGFNFDPRVYHQLRLNMVDDTDKDFEVQNLARQHVQYRTAFDKFMAILPYGIIGFSMMIMLIGFILWLKEDPANSARSCVNAMKPLLERAAEAVVPPPA